MRIIRKGGVTTPAVLLTNLNINNLFSKVSEKTQKLEDVVMLRKHDFDPIELSKLAEALINKEKIHDLEPKIGKKIAKSVILKPSFFGIGVDLKKLFDIVD